MSADFESFVQDSFGAGVPHSPWQTAAERTRGNADVPLVAALREKFQCTRFGCVFARGVRTHLLMVTKGLPRQIQLVNGSGSTQAGDPYRRIFLKDGVIMPGQSIRASLVFQRERQDSQVNYSLGLLSGQGQP